MAMALLVLVVASLVLGNNGMDGERRSFSRDEDLELDRLLKVLNKPAIKTIQTENGDTFDCVDIDKQPAFDNPLLKNHSLQLSPTSLPKSTVDVGASSEDILLKIGLHDGGCPQGTVPIWRTQKEDLVRANYHSGFGKQNQKIHPALTPAFPGQHVVTLSTSEGYFYGVEAEMNVWSLQVAPDHYSFAKILVQSGFKDQMNTIQAGWAVGHYNDSLTRLFGYWTTGRGTGCFDAFCPGFVQVSPDVPLGISFGTVSTYNGRQYVLPLLVFKDPITENWWLVEGNNNNNPVGYWPASLFDSLSTYALMIGWGGETISPRNSLSPPMGSGHFAEENYGKACFQRKLQYVDVNNSLWTPSDDMLSISADQPPCYNWLSGVSKEWGEYLYFGGPGGNCGN